MIIDGEEVSDREVKDLMHMVDHDCKEFAGAFFEQDRSAKFRKSWRDVGRMLKLSPQDCFVEHAWKSFYVHVRQFYSAQLTDPAVPVAHKDKLHKALILMFTAGQSPQAQDAPVQLAPNTQQFEGDKFENRHIAETYGEEADPVSRTLGIDKIH